jgi:dihydrofolate reductase
MPSADSRVTIHMVASLDGFIARRDGRVDWMDTNDHFANGVTLQPDAVAAFLQAIDCYVMGARTYEAALSFEAQGLGWAYGDTPVFVFTHRELPRTRDTVTMGAGDLATIFNEQLRPRFRSIWMVGGSALATACVRRGLADEIWYTMLPVIIGDGVRFFEQLDRDIALHLADVKAYDSGMVELRYDVHRDRSPHPS